MKKLFLVLYALSAGNFFVLSAMEVVPENDNAPLLYTEMLPVGFIKPLIESIDIIDDKVSFLNVLSRNPAFNDTIGHVRAHLLKGAKSCDEIAKLLLLMNCKGVAGFELLQHVIKTFYEPQSWSPNKVKENYTFLFIKSVPHFYALSRINSCVIEGLIKMGADVNREGASLIAAVAEIVVAILNDPIAQRANNIQVNDSIIQMLKTIENLIVAGADVNAKNESGMTALMIFAKYGDVKVRLQYKEKSVIETLLAADADVSLTNDEGKTAVDLAATDEVKLMLLGEGPALKKQRLFEVEEEQ